MTDPWGGPEGSLLYGAALLFLETLLIRCRMSEMLKELPNVRQIKGEGLRRWFISDDLELILWYDDEKKLNGFQICYDKLAGTRTITWKMVNTADGRNKSIIISDGPYNKSRIYSLVERDTETLEENLREFILKRLNSHGG